MSTSPPAAPEAFHYPIFSKNDFSAFWALFTDNFANLLVITTVCKGVFKMPDELVFGRILPGAAFAILFGVGFYSWQAHRLAKRERRADVTALPYGISTPVLFVYLFGVMGPIYFSTQDATLAWQVGLGAGFLGGIVAALGALVGPFVKRVTPRAGMLGTLSGIALVWIGVHALTYVFESPIVGFLSLTVILWGLVGRFRLPFNAPAGLVALVLGSVVALILGESKLSAQAVSFNLPLPWFGDLLAGLKHLFAHSELFLVLIPVQVYNFVETMNNVESAEAKGDAYPVATSMAFDGVGTMVSALFGSPFPTTVYIGHPGYKRIGARAGYALGVGVVLLVAAVFGLLALLSSLVPMAATAPILVYIAISMISESAAAVPASHAMAIAMAMLPHVSDLLVTKWSSMLEALRQTGAEKLPAAIDSPELIAALKAQGVHLVGNQALKQGSILTGMLWGGFTALIIDGKLQLAGCFSLAAGAMASVGILHAPALHAPAFSEITVGYLLMGAFLIVYPQLSGVTPLDPPQPSAPEPSAPEPSAPAPQA